MATKTMVNTVLVVMLTATLSLAIAVGRGESKQLNEVPQCPKAYPLDGIALTKVPSNWVGRVDARFDLQAASIVEGHPDRLGELVPEVIEKKGGDSDSLYNSLNGDPKYAAWLSCNYGLGGEIRLFQKLPPNIHQCTMKYKYDRASKTASLSSYSCK